MKVHELKIQRCYMLDIVREFKKFEIRKNDRNFEVGDILHLKEINEKTVDLYTGCEQFAKVIYIHDGLGLQDGYVVMGIKLIHIEDGI